MGRKDNGEFEVYSRAGKHKDICSLKGQQACKPGSVSSAIAGRSIYHLSGIAVACNLNQPTPSGSHVAN